MQGWLGVLSLLPAALAVWALWYAIDRGGRFWRLVGAHPDIALAVLVGDPSCVVDRTPEDRAKYAGPFSFVDKAGRQHDVYMLAENIKETQARFFNIIAITVAAQRLRSRSGGS